MHDNIELHSTPLSDIPRNVKQISNHKSIETNKSNKNFKSCDEFQDALINRKKVILLNQ